MAKALNQNFYSSILYGGEFASESLRLEATSNSTKGAIELVGSVIDLIISGKTGRFTHTNSVTRTYTLPDIDGTVLVSGLLTAAGDLLYASAPSTYAALHSTATSALATTSTGMPVWRAGAEAQFFQVLGGDVVFAALPHWVGNVDDSTAADNLPRYLGANNHLGPLTTVASRALLSNATAQLVWDRITTGYLAGATGALANGVAGQRMQSLGDGTFGWIDDPSVVNAGLANRVAFYAANGTTVSSSGFAEFDEAAHAMVCRDLGRLRLYQLASAGSSYVELRAPAVMAGSVSWSWPPSDGVAGATLQTDGFGNLSFVFIDNGTVASSLQNQLAYYATSGNDVTGLATVVSRALLSPAGVPTWSLITAGYLSTTGGVPLGNGTSSYVLIADGTGNFSWADVTTLNGKVNSGVAGFLPYYASTGTQVTGSTFVYINDLSRELNLYDGAILRLFQSAGSGVGYVGFQVPTSLVGSVLYMLPASDGTPGQALLTDGFGQMSWQTVGRGTVQTGTAGTLAYYNTATNVVQSLPNIPSLSMATDSSGAMAWRLLTEEYFSTTGGLPLGPGLSDQVVISDGFGNFKFVDADSLVGKINSGIATHVAIYPFGGTGTEVSSSNFLQTNESAKSFELLYNGQLRFFDSAFFAGLRAPTLLADVSWTLPAADASSAGQAMISDAAGVLSFYDIVQAGSSGSLAYYSSTAKQVSPITDLTVAIGSLTASGTLYTIQGAASTSLVVASGSGGTLDLGGDSVGVKNGLATVARFETVLGQAYLSLLNRTPLRIMDSTGAAYVGLTAPAIVTGSMTYELPAADGSSGFVMATDGAGHLSWIEVGRGVVSTGTLNSIPYYSGLATVSSSSLLIPSGLPVSNGEALIASTAGQLSYAMLVAMGGTAGDLAYYTAGQTVSHSSDMAVDAVNHILILKTGTALEFWDGAGANSASFEAPAVMTGSYAVTLPSAAPNPGEVLTAVDASTLQFLPPGGNRQSEQSGVIPATVGAAELNVIFQEAFASIPQSVMATWSTVGSPGSAGIPSLAVKEITQEGFILSLSEPVADYGTYEVFWNAKVSVDSTMALLGYVVGGDAGGLLGYILTYILDSDTLSPTALNIGTSIGYAAGVSSSTKGYILGGMNPATSAAIRSLTHQTGAFATLAATLTTARSSAAGVGNHSYGYAAGGLDSSSSALLSIEKLDQTLETMSTLAGSLSSASNGRGSANSRTDGYVVNANATSTTNKINFATDSVLVGPAIGVADVQAGCNVTGRNLAMFGDASGNLYSVNTSTDVVTTIPNMLNSTTGLSAAFNSMSKGYFAGVQLIESVDFSTNAVTTVNQLLVTNAVAASSASFQSMGLM